MLVFVIITLSIMLIIAGIFTFMALSDSEFGIAFGLTLLDAMLILSIIFTSIELAN